LLGQLPVFLWPVLAVRVEVATAVVAVAAAGTTPMMSTGAVGKKKGRKKMKRNSSQTTKRTLSRAMMIYVSQCKVFH